MHSNSSSEYNLSQYVGIRLGQFSVFDNFNEYKKSSHLNYVYYSLSKICILYFGPYWIQTLIGLYFVYWLFLLTPWHIFEYLRWQTTFVEENPLRHPSTELLVFGMASHIPKQIRLYRILKYANVSFIRRSVDSPCLLSMGNTFTYFLSMIYFKLKYP